MISELQKGGLKIFSRLSFFITAALPKRLTAQITEKYLWSGLTTLLAVYDGSDNLLMRFEYAAGRTPVAMTKGGQRYYLAYDQVGTLRAVTDASGNTVKRVGYDTFGNVLTDSDPLFEVPFGFAGGLYDEDTGLIRFGYRDYDPNAGRWTAKDPIGFAGGDTDLYGYCLGDPISLTDPNGLIVDGGIVTGPAAYALGTAIAAGIAYYGAPIAADIGKWLGEKLFNESSEGDDDPCKKGKKGKKKKSKKDYDKKERGQQYEELCETQKHAQDSRPSIKDEKDEWHGVKKRPKQNRIFGNKKSKQKKIW